MGSCSVAVVFAATAVAAGRVFVPVAGSAVGAAARSAAVSLHQPLVAPSSGVPVPAFAGVSVVPDPASRRAFPAVADISYQPSGSPWSVEQDVLWVGGREDGLRWWDGYWILESGTARRLAAERRDDWMEASKRLLLSWRVRLRGRSRLPAWEWLRSAACHGSPWRAVAGLSAQPAHVGSEPAQAGCAFHVPQLPLLAWAARWSHRSRH